MTQIAKYTPPENPGNLTVEDSGQGAHRFALMAETNIPGHFAAVAYVQYRPNAEFFAAAPETAAERDRLKEQLTRTEMERDLAIECHANQQVINGRQQTALQKSLDLHKQIFALEIINAELLKACKDMKHFIDQDPDVLFWVKEQARIAIAKAEGGVV